MDFKLASTFMEAFEELNKLDEDTDREASKKFWAAAKATQIDADAFHAAYDDELKELGLADIFTAEGAFTSRGVYGRIKAAKDSNPDSWAVRAVSRLWVLRYKDNVKFPCELEADKAAEEERLRREEQKRAEEEAAKVAKKAKFKEYQELLKTYISKADSEVIAAYEKASGVSAIDGITLSDEGEEPVNTWGGKPIHKYGIHFKGWSHYYPVRGSALTKETTMVNTIITGCKKATLEIREKNGTNTFKTIDVLAKNDSASVTLLGESGKLYELSKHFKGTITVRVDGGDPEPADVIDEPYEVIFARVWWDDGNRSTLSNSYAAQYYSWNSKYADRLDRVPTEFGRTDGYIGSYTVTKKVNNPTSKEYCHADGIDSWAVTKRCDGATG